MFIKNDIALPCWQGIGRIVRHRITVPRFIPLTQHSVTSHCSSLLDITNLSGAVILTTQELANITEHDVIPPMIPSVRKREFLSPVYLSIFLSSSIYIYSTYCFVRILYTVEVPQAIARDLEVALTEVTPQSPEYGITYYGDRLVRINIPLPALLPGKCLCY